MELAPLSIDGLQMVLVAGRIPAEHRVRIEAIVRGAGGRLIDGAPRLLSPAGESDGEGEQLEGYGA